MTPFSRKNILLFLILSSAFVLNGCTGDNFSSLFLNSIVIYPNGEPVRSNNLEVKVHLEGTAKLAEYSGEYRCSYVRSGTIVYADASRSAVTDTHGTLRSLFSLQGFNPTLPFNDDCANIYGHAVRLQPDGSYRLTPIRRAQIESFNDIDLIRVEVNQGIDETHCQQFCESWSRSACNAYVTSTAAWSTCYQEHHTSCFPRCTTSRRITAMTTIYPDEMRMVKNQAIADAAVGNAGRPINTTSGTFSAVGDRINISLNLILNELH